MDRRRWLKDRLYRAWRPLGNGYCESFNSKLRDELQGGEIFFSLAEAQVLIEAYVDRDLAASLQPSAPTQLPQLQTAGARDDHLSRLRRRAST
jgi:hypothetical protein